MQTKELSNKRKGTLAAILLMLSVMAHFSLFAQVTIGGLHEPAKGAILDLNSTVKGGLVLSNVNITAPTEIPGNFPEASSANEPALKAGLTGAIVYNTNADLCTGVHVWNGDYWERIAPSPIKAPGTTLTSPNAANQFGVGTVNFMASFPGAKTYRWYVSESNNDYGNLDTITTDNIYSKFFSIGSYKVKVIMDDCRTPVESNELFFTRAALSPNFGSAAGNNYIYIYGEFEDAYASSRDYIQDGLVAHYDGIDNTGLGDKYHSNTATVWKDVNGSNGLKLNNSPLPGGGWKSNGFYFNNNTYFNVVPVPDNWPVGSAARTVEITFITPPSGTNTSYIKALFMYGKNAYGQIFGIQYHDRNFFPIEGCSGTYNYAFSINSLEALRTDNKLNTTTSIYYGNAVKNSKVFVNGIDAPPNISSGTGTLNTTTDEACIGSYSGGGRYATDFQVLSVRLYNRTLNDAEVQTNAAVDQRRFIAPPTVKIDGQSCQEVVVLSSNILMCKVPPGTIGEAEVTVNDKVYGMYKYVDSVSDFYISEISPIIGSANMTLTLTGKNLDWIDHVEIGGVPCLEPSLVDSEKFTCKLPPNPNGKGETDITITMLDGTVYHFAKVFEYN
jgi:hypothetical protein